jgi:hypothetical protein
MTQELIQVGNHRVLYTEYDPTPESPLGGAPAGPDPAEALVVFRTGWTSDYSVHARTGFRAQTGAEFVGIVDRAIARYRVRQAEAVAKIGRPLYRIDWWNGQRWTPLKDQEFSDNALAWEAIRKLQRQNPLEYYKIVPLYGIR